MINVRRRSEVFSIWKRSERQGLSSVPLADEHCGVFPLRREEPLRRLQSVHKEARPILEEARRRERSQCEAHATRVLEFFIMNIHLFVCVKF